MVKFNYIFAIETFFLLELFSTLKRNTTKESRSLMKLGSKKDHNVIDRAHQKSRKISNVYRNRTTFQLELMFFEILNHNIKFPQLFEK